MINIQVGESISLTAFVVALISIIAGIWQFIVIRRAEARQREFENFHRLVKWFIEGDGETPEYLRRARAVGMSDEDRAALVSLLAADPAAGVALGGAASTRCGSPDRAPSDGPNMLPLDWLARLLPELAQLHALAQASAFRA